MLRKERLTAVLVLALGVATAVPAFADCRNRSQLGITAAGAAIDSSGQFEARAQGADQSFRVSIDARVADGTVFEVFVNSQLAGTITIALGVGQLDLDNKDGAVLPLGVDPVCGVTTVAVATPGGDVILEGSL